MKIINKLRQYRYKILIYPLFYFITLFIIGITLKIPDQQVSFMDDFRMIIGIIIIPFTLKYIVYMIISPWYYLVKLLNDKKNEKLNKNYAPLVSVLVPAWNEEVGIIRTIESLVESDYKNLEVIIINDGSTDQTDRLVKKFIKQYQQEHQDSMIKLVYHYKTNGGKANALNSGIKIAQGEIIITIDADSIVRKDTVSNFVRGFRDPRVMSVCGNIKIGNTQTITGVVQFLEYLFTFYFKKADSLLNTIYIVGGAAAAYRKTVFEQLGYFDPKNITEDIDLSLRIQAAGMKIVFAADAIVFTEGASDLKGLLKQRIRWKRGRFITFFKHRNLFFSLKKKYNKLLTLFILPLALFSEIELLFELLFVSIFIIYSILNLNFISISFFILMICLNFCIQLFSYYRTHKNINFIYIIPIGWLLFYIATVVEYNALLRVIISLIKKQEPAWQIWKRKGVFNNNP